jgi:hypothetical protein
MAGRALGGGEGRQAPVAGGVPIREGEGRQAPVAGGVPIWEGVDAIRGRGYERVLFLLIRGPTNTRKQRG